jgi:hypothetical protein
MIAFVVVWNLCELIAGTFITHSGYVFTWVDNIAKPVGLAVVIGVIIYLLPGSRSK